MLRQKVAKIENVRATSSPLPGGSAPVSSSANFKTLSGNIVKSKSFAHRFSPESQLRGFSSLRAAGKASSRADLIMLGPGRPNPEYFPWLSMSATSRSTPVASTSGGGNGTASTSCNIGETGFDFSHAMDYGYSGGSPQALRFITEHVELVHEPKYGDWACSMTCGNTSATDIALRMFCSAGDWILAEEHTFTGAIMAARAQGIKVMPVTQDDQGLCANDLDYKLSNWDYQSGPKPFLLYVIPCGQNPTGTTQALARRHAIYAVAEKHDLFLLEDDPYYYLQMDNDISSGTSTDDVADAYLSSLPSSYLSLDTSGRVLRMDTVSKILTPGLRIGWITGSSEVIEKFIQHSESSVLFPSGPSQVLLYKLLDETWGHEGFLLWLTQLSSKYRARRDTLLGVCETHLPRGICRWQYPQTGLFLWVELNLSFHPLLMANEMGIEEIQKLRLDIEERIYAGSLANGVVVSKGSWFAAGSTEQPRSSIGFRLTFAAAPEKQLQVAIQIFAQIVAKEFQIQ